MSAKLDSGKNNTIINMQSDPKDIQDLQQECLGYMKTKKFLAQRICQQQEKIIFLKYVTSSHCDEHEQMYNLVNNLQQELYSIKAIINHSEKEDINSEETSDSDTELNRIQNENIFLKMEIERRKLDLLSNATEVNTIKNQKEILLNEIKEILRSCAGLDIDKLHQYFKKNLSKEILTQINMPLSKGIKYNFLSALSQASYVIESDLVDIRIKNDWKSSKGINKKEDYNKDNKERNGDDNTKSERSQLKCNKDCSRNCEKDVDRQAYFKTAGNVK